MLRATMMYREHGTQGLITDRRAFASRRVQRRSRSARTHHQTKDKRRKKDNNKKGPLVNIHVHASLPLGASDLSVALCAGEPHEDWSERKCTIYIACTITTEDCEARRNINERRIWLTAMKILTGILAPVPSLLSFPYYFFSIPSLILIPSVFFSFFRFYIFRIYYGRINRFYFYKQIVVNRQFNTYLKGYNHVM